MGTAMGQGATIARGLVLAGLFLLALAPRLYSAMTLGWGWDGPGSFNLVNFDEAGSCRAALDGFDYTPFIGYQTIGIATLLGHPPPAGIRGDSARVKAYCHSPAHLLVARGYSAVLGALTVVVVALLALQLLPRQPGAAWLAGALLAVSGFHISQSQTGTVDSASTFFIYSFLALLAWALRRGGSPLAVAASLPLLVAAVWTKYWVFAVFALLAFAPRDWWRYASRGWAPWRIALFVLAVACWLAALTNTEFPAPWLALPTLACLSLVPWSRVRGPMLAVWLLLLPALWLATRIDVVHIYTVGGLRGPFGTSYGAIGADKWLRNLVNLPVVLLVGLGIPACLFLPAGLRQAFADREGARVWLVLLPVTAFALFMAFLAPVTYYRHYLPLLPAAAILAAAGIYRLPRHWRRWSAGLVLAWSALLAWDMVADYHADPRRELRPWFREHPGARVFMSYYVNPPPGSQVALFRPEYAFGEARALRSADYLILSENWYDTAFANELNGPRVDVLARLVKTKPEYARFYRRTLAGEFPWLEPAQAFELRHFMPELLLHRHWYGNFQLFVGDIRIFRVRRG